MFHTIVPSALSWVVVLHTIALKCSHSALLIQCKKVRLKKKLASMGIELVPSALRAHSRQEMCILSIVSGLQFCRNIGEDFSRNPLHSIVQSAVYGKRQRLETFEQTC